MPRFHPCSVGLALALPLLISSVSAADKAAGIARSRAMFAKYEEECTKDGWKKLVVQVEGRSRNVMWKGPKSRWKHGAIVGLHGGSGSYTNFGAGIRLGKPMVQFSRQAIQKGFAVFALDSTWGAATDSGGRSCGKRWDCMATDKRKNVDLPFIKAVITKLIPEKRPAGSSTHVFMTGISNGGYMTILASTHFPELITAFAPVATGDPYGTVMDMSTHPLVERPTAPGVFRDRDTRKKIGEIGAADGAAYSGDRLWPKSDNGKKKPVFRQFHHEGDSVVDMSCMKKAGRQLVRHGFKDDGAFIVRSRGRRSIWSHFWQREYNRPLLEYFARLAGKEQKSSGLPLAADKDLGKKKR